MNKLADSTSPYLLQHKDNPVQWYPWGAEALAKAKKEDKPIIVSIGYSSCHWCHVMAHESFEDTEVAELMNQRFVSIKIDREERPDIDQIYMESIQAMGINGGWPLNVFLTPECKPFYGGTYFPKEGWKQLLSRVSEAFVSHRDQLNESAEKFTKTLQRKESEKYKMSDKMQLTVEGLQQGYSQISERFDREWGGIKKAPKFPMPSIWKYLLGYYHLTGDESARKHALFTLDCISDGGIYDQIGGGFSRYAVDGEWHVPHFEKMLYDNGQLLSIFALGYQLSGKDRYKEVITETIQWISREMTNDQGGLYAALDADSEGVEGKFYTWQIEDILPFAGGHTDIIATYYDLQNTGNWEGTNVLRRLHQDRELAEKFDIPEKELRQIVSSFKEKLFAERSKRIRPGLDDKVLTSWNALALKGICDSYNALQNQEFLDKARSVYQYLSGHLLKEEILLHQAGSYLEGFAEDYACTIQAFITYYETTFETEALQHALSLTKRMIRYFWDETEKLFFYTSQASEQLIARKKELFDNVIPSSNSLMAENLLKLGYLTYDESLKEYGIKLITNVSHMLSLEPEYLSQWTAASFYLLQPVPEIAIVGNQALRENQELQEKFLPVKVVAGGADSSKFPALLEGKTAVHEKVTYFICYDKTCQRPVHNLQEALEQL